MRISSSTLYDINVAALNQQQTKMLHTQQQVSSGRRMITAADDPVAAARALELAQSDSATLQYAQNIDATQNSLILSEGTLQSVTTLLQNAQTLAVNAGNTMTMSNPDRKMIATELQANLDQLISLANSTDGVGNYLFSGFQGKTIPFVNVTAGPTSPVQYNGDDGQRLSQVNASRQLSSTDSGADIFMRIKNGNGTFSAQPDPTSNAGSGNAGNGVISVGSLAVPPPTPAQLGNQYTVSFTIAAGVTTYTVTGKDALGAALPAASLPAPNIPYVSGQSISFNGIQFDIQGVPATGDQFTIAPSTNESIFKTFSDLINTLNTPATSGNVANFAQLSAGINRGLNGLSRGLDNVLTIRASMGSRLKELDTLKLNGEDSSLQYKQALSLLQDVDYNKAITDLTQQKTMLEAAQKSFMQVMNMSMFNYMP